MSHVVFIQNSKDQRSVQGEECIWAKALFQVIISHVSFMHIRTQKLCSSKCATYRDRAMVWSVQLSCGYHPDCEAQTLLLTGEKYLNATLIASFHFSCDLSPDPNAKDACCVLSMRLEESLCCKCSHLFVSVARSWTTNFGLKLRRVLEKNRYRKCLSFMRSRSRPRNWKISLKIGEVVE